MRVNTQAQIGVGMNILTKSQCDEIHYATLEILERVGVNVYEEEALELYRKGGAIVEGNNVKIPAWMVQEALVTAPCRVAVSNRSGERAMFLERGRNYYGGGSDTPYTVDIETGETRVATKADVENFTILGDYLDNVDFVMSMGLASDVPRDNSYIHQFEAMVLNTEKPIIYTAANLKDLKDIVKMAEIAAGGEMELRKNPFIILYNEPNSPLQHSEEAVQKLLYLAEKRLPIIYIPAVMLGATGPVTQAGGVIVANCETLSGLVLHQLKAKGAPFVYGAGVAPMDMKTQVCSYAAPEEHMDCAIMATLASEYYHLPVFVTAGCSDAVTFDQQAGMEAGFNLLTSSMSGGNIIHDLGYLASGMVSSMEMLMLCNETVGMVKFFLKGLHLDANTMALDIIEKVGPGGNFFAEKHTAKNFKTQMFLPKVLNRQSYDQWNLNGGKTFAEVANAKIKDILATHRPKPLDADKVEKIKAVSKRRDDEVS